MRSAKIPVVRKNSRVSWRPWDSVAPAGSATIELHGPWAVGRGHAARGLVGRGLVGRGLAGRGTAGAEAGARHRGPKLSGCLIASELRLRDREHTLRYPRGGDLGCPANFRRRHLITASEVYLRVSLLGLVKRSPTYRKLYYLGVYFVAAWIKMGPAVASRGVGVSRRVNILSCSGPHTPCADRSTGPHVCLHAADGGDASLVPRGLGRGFTFEAPITSVFLH